MLKKEFAQGGDWATGDLGDDPFIYTLRTFWITNILSEKGHCFVGGSSETGFWTSIAVPNAEVEQLQRGKTSLLLRAADCWLKELSVYNQQWRKTSALFQSSDSDRRLTHSTHGRKFHFYTYLVLDSIKTKTESQGQLGSTACLWSE